MSSSPQSPDQSVILHHIDKTYSTLTRVWDSTNKVFYAIPIVSIAVLALGSGVVSVEDQIEVNGLKFKIALWIILGGGTLFIESLFISFFALDCHADRLEGEILRLYSRLNYSDEGMFDDQTSPFRNSAAYNAILGPTRDSKYSKLPKVVRLFDTLIGILFVPLVTFILPIIAQVFAAKRLSSSFGHWIWVPFIFLFVIFIWNFIALVFRKELWSRLRPRTRQTGAAG